MFISAKQESLQILANEKALNINDYIEAQKEKSLVLSSMDIFKEIVLTPNDKIKTDEAIKRINELKNIIPGISILNKNGIVIVGDIDLPGTDYSKQPYFSLEKKKIVFELYYDPLRKQNYYAVVGPIYDISGKNEIGVVSFDLNLNNIEQLMKESVNNNDTEVYLVNDDGLLLTNSKYIGQNNKQGVLIQEVKSDQVKVCLDDLNKYYKDGVVEEHDEKISNYLNYMGDTVMGTHAYVPEITGCVISEERVDETLKFTIVDFIKNIFKN